MSNSNNLADETALVEEEVGDLKKNVGTALLTQFGTQFLQQPQIEKLATALLPKLSELPQTKQTPQASQTPNIIQLLSRLPEHYILAAFMFITGFITIGLLATLAKVLKVPFIFPSLGATTFLFFFTPSLPSASPRNAICGHAIGIIAGYSALLLFGLASAPAASTTGIDTSRILAVGFSLGLTGALMILFKCGHPPGGATTLIVSLGIISEPFSLIVLEAAVIILAILAISINRLAAIDYPIWKRKPKEGVFTPWTPEKAAATSPSAAITWAIFFFVNGFITIGILAFLSMVSKIPFIFPSLGATAFLFFFGPSLPSASPRNAIYGTAIAILSAYFALSICGLTNLGSNIPITDIQQIIAAAISLALTGSFMILLKTPHPPAAATCLIVSLGLIASPFKLFILEFAVVLLALQAFVINRLVATDYPLWKKA
jgi:CBS domain-containing membrane protein